MNLFIFNIFLCLFLQNSFMSRMREKDKSSEMSSRENPSQLRLKRFKDFFKKEIEIISFGCGLLGGISLYALSKKLPKQKRASLAFLGAGMSGGLCFYFNKEKKKDDDKIKEDDKPSALIDRSFCTLDFWLHDAQAKEYLELREKIGKEKKHTVELTKNAELADFITNIKSEINKMYYDQNEEVFLYPTAKLFHGFNAEKYKKKKVRIFNQFILFDDLCDFIKDIEREYLLYFLANQTTIKHNLQGELIQAQYFKTCEADALAAFLAFGYYPDTCLKFFYLEPNMLMTFLENAVYYMYYTVIGGKLREEDFDYKKITKPFEKYCRLKITNVEFKEKEREVKKHLTKITIEKIKEGQALRE